MGYDHILRTIVPRLRRRGVDEATLHLLLVENPARLLAPSTSPVA
jgi:predicted metal-dependent phosphotriesterase family hydrolase